MSLTIYLDDCSDDDNLIILLTQAGHVVIICKDMTKPDIVRAIGNLLAAGLPVVNEVHILNHWR
ncbi:MAG: hypothetical protein NZT92_11010 [Abditibacteriales bacterium]|nr:hypothetical protein [Abditibacteriales bacterium]MDW8366473.1 hypothetical protein [Abditibacteriales bacterium]